MGDVKDKGILMWGICELSVLFFLTSPQSKTILNKTLILKN